MQARLTECPALKLLQKGCPATGSGGWDGMVLHCPALMALRFLIPAGNRREGAAAAAQRHDDEVHGAEAGPGPEAHLPHRQAEARQVLRTLGRTAPALTRSPSARTHPPTPPPQPGCRDAPRRALCPQPLLPPWLLGHVEQGGWPSPAPSTARLPRQHGAAQHRPPRGSSVFIWDWGGPGDGASQGAEERGWAPWDSSALLSPSPFFMMRSCPLKTMTFFVPDVELTAPGDLQLEVQSPPPRSRPPPCSSVPARCRAGGSV